METKKFEELQRTINIANNTLAIEVAFNKANLDTTVLLGEYKNNHMKKYDLTELTSEQADILGMTRWDSENNRLIPLYLFNLLPDDLELTCISGEKKLVGNCNNDIRCGCVAYYVTLK